MRSSLPRLTHPSPKGADDGWASRDYDFASSQLDDFITDHRRNLVNPVARSVTAAAPTTGLQEISRNDA